MAAEGGGRVPGRGRGEEVAGAVSRRAIPTGAFGTVAGCGGQSGGVMCEAAAVARGRAES